MRFPSAPKEGPNSTRPSTRTLLPATSVSTFFSERNQSSIGPNSGLESLSKRTLPGFLSLSAFLENPSSSKRESEGLNPKVKIDLVFRFSGFLQRR